MAFIILFIVVILLVAVYLYVNKNLDYWAKRSVKHEPPIPLFGNHLKNQLGKKSMAMISTELYNKYPDEKVVGYYRGTTPELIIRDLDIVRQILTIDFACFYARGLGRSAKKEPLFRNLFHLEGDHWRLLRQRLTPAFTSAKLKAMFPLVVRCAERLQGVVKVNETRDARELMARFTTEFIGACGFGIEMDTINNQKSQFRELGRRIFTRSYRNMILWPVVELFPEFKEYYKVDSDSIDEAMTAIVEGVRKQRNYKPSGRNDFIDLLLELETKGKIVGESLENRNPDGTPIPVEMEFDLQCMVAQVFIFFAAGFETSSSATSYCLHELAYNPEVQAKVQEEIDRVLLKYDNKICYDAIAEMTYLDQTFKEAMRLFPSLGNLNRVCMARYKIPNTDIVIDRGVKIMIPVQAIQNDEKYFDNPKEFRPERFSPEEVQKRHKFAYLPFGEGPRNCIGAKLGLMQSLAGLAGLLHKFTVEPAPSSERQLAVNPWSNVVQGVKEVPVCFKLKKGKTE